MARIILTTCGTSLYNSSCWEWNNLNKKPLSAITDRRELKRQQIACEEAIIQAKNEDETGVQLAAAFDIESWNAASRLRDLPAELASLKAIQMYLQNLEVDAPLSNTDKLILLHSDSSNEEIDGKFCADVLRETIVKWNLLNPILANNINPKEIKQLAPSYKDKFGKALINVWDYAKKLRQDENSLILNLTGGYKALAILLGAFGKQHKDIPMFYLHEETAYNQIFMMNFQNGKISFVYYNTEDNEIERTEFSDGGPIE